MTFCSAPSRIAQVLMTTRSAASIDGASAQPAASSRPAISSESLRFIWQPSVQTWNRGSAARSGRYSPSRSSAGTAGVRGATEALDGASSRTGSARVARRVSVTAATWYARDAGTPGRRMPAILEAMDLITLLTAPETWIALLTLTVLEIVLGIDNVIFISILVQRLPDSQRDQARLHRPRAGDGRCGSCSC